MDCLEALNSTEVGMLYAVWFTSQNIRLGIPSAVLMTIYFPLPCLGRRHV